MERCSWANGDDAIMRDYHDLEYGRRMDKDTPLFEKLCLEAFQAGLSWRTVLYKREALRRLFFGFDPEKVAKMTEKDVETLMGDASIIRNHRKIEAVIENAKLQLRLFPREGSFKEFVYSQTGGAELSRALKEKGYRFAGETICESFLMSVGAAEGHEKECFLHKGDS